VLTCDELIDILAQKAREAVEAGGEHSKYGVVSVPPPSSYRLNLPVGKMMSNLLRGCWAGRMSHASAW